MERSCHRVAPGARVGGEADRAATGTAYSEGVSDLQCAARLHIARHGDADYPVHGVLSDHGGWLTDKGVAQVHELAEELRATRVSTVCSSSMSRAVQSAEVAAADLDVASRVVAGLQEYDVGEWVGIDDDDPRPTRVFESWLDGDLDAGFPGGEDGHAVVARFRDALGEIADLHRGEDVLVFSHGGVMSLVIPRLAGNVRSDLARRRHLPSCKPARVDVDADGWRVVSWPGTDDIDDV